MSDHIALKSHLKQLKLTIDKYEEAIDKVDLFCYEYSPTPEECQQAAKDMESFRKLQLKERMNYLTELLGG